MQADCGPVIHADRPGILHIVWSHRPPMHPRLVIFLVLLVAGSLPAIDTAPARAVRGWHHRVWTIYPVEKVSAVAELPDKPELPMLELSAAKDEREPFVVLLRSQVPLREVTVVAEDLHAPDGGVIQAAQFTVRRMAYISIDEPSGTRIKQAMPYPVGTGSFPDPLLEGKGDARPAHNLQFLITVHVPREVAAGTYEGALRLRFRKETWMPPDINAEDVVPVRLKVRSFAMPEHSSLLNTSHANLRELPEPQRTPERVALFQREFVAHRQTPEPLMPSPRVRVEKNGDLTVDTAAWEQAVAASFASGGTHVFVPVWDFFPEPAHAQGLYFLYHWPAVAKQKWFGATICGEDKTLTADFRRLFGSYLKHMRGVLEKHGWLDRAFITTMDEPYTYHTGDRSRDIPANNYEVIRNYVTFVREVAPGLRTFCTADPVEGLNGFIDHWCLRNLDHAAEAKARAEQHGEVFTFCDNYRTFIDYPAAAARSFGWLAWKTGARGWLTYETMGNYRSAWEGPVVTYAQFSGATVWGMGQMFYPDPLTGAPLPSLRWELMREGCDDYEYLWLLRAVLKAHPDDAAQRLLDSVAASVVAGGGDAETTATVSAKNEASNLAVHRLREQVADAIERLQAK